MDQRWTGTTSINTNLWENFKCSFFSVNEQGAIIRMTLADGSKTPESLTAGIWNLLSSSPRGHASHGPTVNQWGGRWEVARYIKQTRVLLMTQGFLCITVKYICPTLPSLSPKSNQQLRHTNFPVFHRSLPIFSYKSISLDTLFH